MTGEVKKPRVKRGWRLVLPNEEIEYDDLVHNGRSEGWRAVITSVGKTPAQMIAKTGNANFRYIRKKPEAKEWLNPWD